MKIKLNKTNNLIKLGYLLLAVGAAFSAILLAKDGSFSPLPTDILALILPIILLMIGGITLGTGYFMFLKISNNYLRALLSIAIGVFSVVVFYYIFILLRALLILLGIK